VWGYAIVSALVENLGKVVAWRVLGHRTGSHQRFLGRLHQSAAPCPGRNC